jgi:hypothetical protein
MGQRQQRNPGVLWVLIVLAIAYSVALRSLHTLTGLPMLDVFISVAFGLYICSHPAANAIKMLYLERYSLREVASDWEILRWLGLNLLVLLVGWMVIFFGLVQFAATRAVIR